MPGTVTNIKDKTPAKGKAAAAAKAPAKTTAPKEKTAAERIAELEKMVAETQAQLKELSEKGSERAKTDKELKLEAWRKPVDEFEMDPETTLLGKAQRLDREAQLNAVFRAVRNMRYDAVPKLLVDLSKQVAKNGGCFGDQTPERVFEEVTTKSNRGRKANGEGK